MANILYANNAAGTLNGGITNVQTTLTLNAGQAALFPSPTPPQVFYVTLTDAATQTLIEIVKVTAVSGNVFSIVRGQDGTSALSWLSGDIVSQRAIRLEMQGWENAAEGLFGAQGVAVTPSTTLGVTGTTLGDNAQAGAVGETLTASASGIVLASGTPAIAATLSLSPGDWDVQGTAQLVASGGAAMSNTLGGLSQSGSFGGLGQNWQLGAPLTANGAITLPTPVVRFNVSTPSAVFVVVQASFSSGAATAAGFIRARRVR
jgi:hypothetical protein